MAVSAHRPAVLFILVTVFLDLLGIGIIIPVLPQLVTSMLDGDSSRAAHFYGVIAASYALMQFLFAPVLGALSDRVGRRPVLLLSLFGFGVSYVVLGLAPTLGWLFAARIMAGVTGASVTTANAYIADISTAENRAQNFGLIGVAFGMGFIFGPALGGVLGHLGPRIPFFASAAIVAVNLLYGWLVLPESLAAEHRRPFSLREGNPLGGLLRLRRFPLVAGLALAFVFVALAQRGLETVWVLYTEYRFGWQALQNGLVLALVGVTAAIVQGGAVRPIVARIGERRAAMLGLSVAALGYLGFGLADRGWMILPVIVLSSLGGLAGPAIQGMVAGSVPPSDQGAVQGTLTSLMSLTSIAAPLISTQLLSHFTGAEAPVELPGAPFFASAAFVVVALLVVMRTVSRRLAATAPA